MAGFPDSTIINLSSPTGTGVRLPLLIVSIFAPPSFGFRLFRAPIHAAPGPRGLTDNSERYYPSTICPA